MRKRTQIIYPIVIDRRIRYFLMIDTETCNTINNNGKLDMSNVLVYDIGLAVVDKRGKVYLQKSLIPPRYKRGQERGCKLV